MQQISVAVKKDLDDVMDTFGYNILRALVTDIVPDAKVKAAMNDINARSASRSRPRPAAKPTRFSR